MKKFLIIAVMFCCTFAATAQVKFGVKLGAGSTDFNPKDLIVLNADDAERLKIGVNNSSYGYHFGLFTQIKAKRFFIQPEVLINSSRIDYSVEDFESNLGSTIKSETHNFVDIPVMTGIKLGPLRLQAGPVAHLYLNSTSELTDISGYRQKFDEAAWGLQYGLGLDIWRAVLDFKWERNYSNFGDHIVIDDVPYNFDGSPDRFIVSLGFKF